MLILTRKKDESIIINDNIEVMIIEADDGKVKLGIKAPKAVQIHRKEVYQSIIDENKASKNTKVNVDKLKKIIDK